jgi:tetratricopeptide (TPR) repeat protein
MRKKFTVLLTLYICSFAANAQDIAQANEYFSTADSLKKAGAPDSAIYYFEKAATSFRALQQHKLHAESLNQLGVILTRQDKYTEAKKMLDSALVIGLRELGENTATVANTYIGLGVIYNALEDYNQSLRFHHKSLSIRLKVLGKHHTDVATSYGNIGNVYLNAKEYSNAIKNHTHALRIRKKLYGGNGIELVESYNGLGNTYREKGDYKKSLEAFQESLRLRKLKFGETHKSVAKTCKDISNVYYLMKNQEQGDLYKKKAEEISNALK